MGIVELLGLAGSVSLLSGWRLYLTIFVTGLAMRLQWISLPENLQILDALANPWVLAISAFGAVAEFFADKILWLDSAWDTIHTAIRPLGGALLALAVVDAGDPVWQVVVFLLGGGAALVSHGAKSGARALVNTSPEPVSNAVVSTGEDIATGGLLFLAFANPVAALVIASLMLILCLILIYKGFRLWRKIVSNGS
ncbi:DUF4126 domain-containing protein [Sphingorhabdus sp. 109]|jgi:hypothetical protein|uniref:DUF4126 domain-containing protein n=1 Tax=Sphingorhabdus sp. 109 TaxID=2653173 RepID=UPI0012F0300B|nr:DUF4126 domain-containing protein [Sphingorhabdus sp. 109]VWX56886.1 conserved membrane hypothetical protein [Sphingorhabdus sp. 109]